MKTCGKNFFLIVLFSCLSIIWTETALADIDLPFSTTFDCDCDGNPGNGDTSWLQYSDPLVCDGVSKWLGNTNSCGDYTHIEVAANYSGGGGGKGMRNFIGDGKNDNTGSVNYEFNTPQTELWVRWYARWESGFKWSFINGVKLLYFDMGQPDSFQPKLSGFDNVYFRIYYGTGDTTPEGDGWDIMHAAAGVDDGAGHKRSDGSWHCIEVHVKKETLGNTDGVAEIWVDDVLQTSNTGIAFGDAGKGWDNFIFYSNQQAPSNGGKCLYVDYDDLAISNTGYIGPITGGGGPDIIPPSVSISSPTSGHTVLGNVVISASASDDVGVAGVQFKLDGADIGAEDTTSSYSISWDTTTVSDGSYTLTAAARDAAGNQTTSSPVDVAISNGRGGDTIPPSVSITAPTEGQTVSGIIAVSATASDNVGVAGVQFKLDGADLGAEDTTSPYSISCNTTTLSDGSHALTAAARDTAENQTTSSPVDVTISNGGGGGVLLFEESFEDADFASRGWYDNTNLQLSTAEHISGSNSSVEYYFLQGATTPTSGGAIRKKFTDTDEVYVSYYVKYSSNWEGSNRTYHPHEFLILSNLDGDWDALAYNYLTTYIEQNEGEPLVAIQDGKNIDEGNIDVDLTGAAEQRAVAGCNGDSDGHGNGDCYVCGSVHCNGKQWKAGSVYFQDTPGQYYKNDWHHIEVYIQLNSISDGIGQKDGVIKYWYDGNLIIEHNDVILRTGQHPDMKFNQFIIAPWIGDGSPVDQTFWIDNLTVATSRVLLLPPSAPTNVHIE